MSFESKNTSLELPLWLSGKESACDSEDKGDVDSVPGKIPWRRVWQPTPVFLPGEPHGQRSLAGYSPQGHRVRYDCSDSAHKHATPV